MTDTPLSDDVVERVADEVAEKIQPYLRGINYRVSPDTCLAVAAISSRAALEAARYGEMVEALRGLMAEFEKFSRYGSPIATQANEAMQRARRALLSSIGASHE